MSLYVLDHFVKVQIEGEEHLFAFPFDDTADPSLYYLIDVPCSDCSDFIARAKVRYKILDDGYKKVFSSFIRVYSADRIKQE